VCKLKKLIFGLKQSSQVLFDKFNCIISKVGLQKCYSNHFVFIRKTSSCIVLLVVYIDDIPLSENDNGGIEKAKEYLKTQIDRDMPRYDVLRE